MREWWLTIYHNAAVLPMGHSVQLDCDPTPWLGEPCGRTGSLITYYIDDIVIVLSDGKLTTPT